VDDKLTKLMDRIKKLLAKANDPGVTEAEAASYAEKAQQLLTENNMTILDLPEEESLKEAPIGQFEWYPKYAGDSWRQEVAVQAARYYMCSILTTTLKKGRKTERGFILVGRQASCMVAKSMIDYLFATGVRLSREYGKKYGGDQRTRHEFERGYGAQMAYRISEMLKKGVVEATNTNLPVLYSREKEAVQQYIDEFIKPKEKIVSIKNFGYHSWAGVEAANTVSLNTQVEKGREAAALPKGQLLISR
jgi:hypothetical protein